MVQLAPVMHLTLTDLLRGLELRIVKMLIFVLNIIGKITSYTISSVLATVNICHTNHA